MAIVNEKYHFIMIVVGANGRVSDNGGYEKHGILSENQQKFLIGENCIAQRKSTLMFL